jgi:hypothetical protein
LDWPNDYSVVVDNTLIGHISREVIRARRGPRGYRQGRGRIQGAGHEVDGDYGGESTIAGGGHKNLWRSSTSPVDCSYVRLSRNNAI